MEQGAEFSCEERGILRDAQGSRGLSKAGGPGGVSSVRIVLGRYSAWYEHEVWYH